MEKTIDQQFFEAEKAWHDHLMVCPAVARDSSCAECGRLADEKQRLYDLRLNAYVEKRRAMMDAQRKAKR